MKAGWEDSTLGSLCQFENGDRGKNYPGKKALVTAGIPFINAGHITDGRITWEAMDFIPEDRFELLGSGKIRESDFLFCLRGSLGKFGYVDRNGPGAIASSLVIVRPDTSKLDTGYLQAYFRSTLCAGMIAKFAGGAAQPNLSAKSLRAFSIPLPPLEEQRRIVAILDEAFAGLARARANAEANLADARELFDEAVDKLLSDESQEWKKDSLSEMVGPVFTGPFGSLLHKSDYIENGTPLVNPANLGNGMIVPDARKTVSDSSLAKLASYRLREGDIVIGRRGEMGRCAVVQSEQEGWLCGTGSFFIRPKGNVVPGFAAHMLRSRSYVVKLEAISTGATMANLSNKALGAIEFPLPPKEVQERLLKKIEEINASIQTSAAHFHSKVGHLDALRQSLLQRAFAGELT